MPLIFMAPSPELSPPRPTTCLRRPRASTGRAWKCLHAGGEGAGEDGDEHPLDVLRAAAVEVGARAAGDEAAEDAGDAVPAEAQLVGAHVRERLGEVDHQL